MPPGCVFKQKDGGSSLLISTTRRLDPFIASQVASAVVVLMARVAMVAASSSVSTTSIFFLRLIHVGLATVESDLEFLQFHHLYHKQLHRPIHSLSIVIAKCKPQSVTSATPSALVPSSSLIYHPMLDPQDAGGSTSNSKDELPQQEQESSIASIDKIPKQQQPQSTSTCNDTTTTTHTSSLLKSNDITSTKDASHSFIPIKRFNNKIINKN